MRYLELLYTPTEKTRADRPHRPRVEYECDCGVELDPVEAVAACPWEETAEVCLSTVYWVRDELGRILAVGLYQPGDDPLHPDLVVVCGGETRVYVYEATPESYRARLRSVVRLPGAANHERT